MTTTRLIAVEYEKGLHYPKCYTVANLAPEYLNSKHNKNSEGNHIYHKEGTNHQNEFNSKPAATMDELCLDFLNAEYVNELICAELGIINIPISENGAGEGIINQDVSNRTKVYQAIFGEEELHRLIKISGIHIHIDQCEDRITEQFNFLTLYRPTIALTSTSGISHQGINGVNCHRYKLISDPVGGVFSKIPEERDYINSIEELEGRDLVRYEKWKKEFINNSDLPEEFFMENFQPENTGYPDIRYRPDIGVGTFEMRTNDTAPLDVVLGQAALVLYGVNRMIDENIKISYSNNNNYSFNKKEVILPKETTIDHYTNLAINNGLKNEEVQKYLLSLINFSREYAPENEKDYFEPLIEMVNSGENLATKIINYVSQHRQKIGNENYDVHEVALANKLIYEKQQQAINYLKKRINFKERGKCAGC